MQLTYVKYVWGKVLGFLFVADCFYFEMLLFAKSFQMVHSTVWFSTSLLFLSFAFHFSLIPLNTSFWLVCLILNLSFHHFVFEFTFTDCFQLIFEGFRLRSICMQVRIPRICPLNNCFALISHIQVLAKVHFTLSSESTYKRHSTIIQLSIIQTHTYAYNKIL